MTLDACPLAYQEALCSLVRQVETGDRSEPRDVRMGARVVHVLEAATAAPGSGRTQPVATPV